MIELEQVQVDEEGNDGGKTSIHEYEVVVQSLLRDLETSKAEQMRLRLELVTLHRENTAAKENARQSLSHPKIVETSINDNHKESLEILKNRLTTMEQEKDSMFQLWQTSLKSVDTLEEQLRISENNAKSAKHYEEQLKNVKETYSEAIKALETKLLQTKENFVKHQSQWSSNNEKIEILTKEKNDLSEKLENLQRTKITNEETNRIVVERQKTDLEALRTELERIRKEKSEIQTKLDETRIFATKIVAKDEESKSKILEAIEIVETAVREKDLALKSEARAHEERAMIESRFQEIIDNEKSRFAKELEMAKNDYEMNTKKMSIEMKELKCELREKITILDRCQRENRLMEEELEKCRHGSETTVQRSSLNIFDLEEKLKDAYSRIDDCEERWRKKYDEKIRLSDERIYDLETKLQSHGDKLRKAQINSNVENDERIREADERTKEILERYSTLERRLSRVLNDKENIACELRNLQINHDREILRRDNERRSQEFRIRELHEELQNFRDNNEKINARCNSLMKQVESLQQNNQDKFNTRNVNVNESQISNAELTMRLRTLQEKFDRRTRELSQHVEIHQKLCSKWKDEAKWLTTKFQIRSKELREKINILRKENDELNKELLMSRQQLALCRVQSIHRYDQEDETR